MGSRAFVLFTELNRNCSALPSWKLAADTITQASGLEHRLSFRSLTPQAAGEKNRCGPAAPPWQQVWAQPSLSKPGWGGTLRPCQTHTPALSLVLVPSD